MRRSISLECAQAIASVVDRHTLTSFSTVCKMTRHACAKRLFDTITICGDEDMATFSRTFIHTHLVRRFTITAVDPRTELPELANATHITVTIKPPTLIGRRYARMMIAILERTPAVHHLRMQVPFEDLQDLDLALSSKCRQLHTLAISFPIHAQPVTNLPRPRSLCLQLDTLEFENDGSWNVGYFAKSFMTLSCPFIRRLSLPRTSTWAALYACVQATSTSLVELRLEPFTCPAHYDRELSLS